MKKLKQNIKEFYKSLETWNSRRHEKQMIRLQNRTHVESQKLELAKIRHQNEKLRHSRNKMRAPIGGTGESPFNRVSKNIDSMFKQDLDIGLTRDKKSKGRDRFDIL